MLMSSLTKNDIKLFTYVSNCYNNLVTKLFQEPESQQLKSKQALQKHSNLSTFLTFYHFPTTKLQCIIMHYITCSRPKRCKKKKKVRSGGVQVNPKIKSKKEERKQKGGMHFFPIK